MRTLLLPLAAYAVIAFPVLSQDLSSSVIQSGQDGVAISQSSSEMLHPDEVLSQSGAPGSRLDVTLSETRSVRSDDALVERRVVQAWTGSDWADEVRNVYAYGEDGTLALMVEQQSDNSVWVDMSRVTYGYADGQSSEEVRQRFQGGEWVNAARISFSYTNGYLTERLEQVWNGSAWDHISRILISVDGSGNRTEALYQDWNGTSWDDDQRYFFTYVGASGDIAAIRGEVWNGSAWLNTSRETWSYDAGLRSEILGERWQGGAWLNDYLRTYSYESGDLVEARIQEWDGTLWQDAYQFLYTNDADGNRTMVVERGYVDTTWVNVVRTLFEYRSTTASEQDAATSALAFSVYPNPVIGAATLGFELEQAGAVAWSAFDVTGRRVAGEPERTVSAGAHAMHLDLRGLPAGVYVVQLRTERQVTTQRVVVVK